MAMIKDSLFSTSTYSIDPLCNQHHRLSIFPCISKSAVLPCDSFKSVLRFPFSTLKASSQQAAITSLSPVPAAKAGIGFRKALKWWEKALQPNMRDVTSTQDLVDSLRYAGDKLVVVSFFSPGCGACRALHPKICQLAQMNPDIEFVLVNSEEHKSMCYTLRVHVLPFFRFYKGALGRVCSFSCTTATIKKFKDAVAKYNVDFCSIGSTKGLEEEELLALAANRELSFSYTAKAEPPLPVPEPEELLIEAVEVPRHSNSRLLQPLPLPLSGSPVSSSR